MTLSTRGRFAMLIALACLLIASVTAYDVLTLGRQAVLGQAASGHALATLALAWQPQTPAPAFIGMFAGGIAIFAIAGGLCIRATRVRAELMLLQLALGGLLESDLLYLVAAQAGFLLPYPAGLRWLAASAGVLAFSFLPLALRLAQAHPACNLAGLAPPPAFLGLATEYPQELALQAFAYCIGRLLRDQLERRARLTEAHATLLAAQRGLAESVQRSERQRVDEQLGQWLDEHLGALQQSLRQAAAVLDGAARQSLAVSEQLAAELGEEVRRAITPASPDLSLPLEHALHTLCAGIPQPRVQLRFDPAARAVPPGVAHTALRSVQEAISNAIRHSGAALVQVEVAHEQDGLAIRVRDDGRGAGRLGGGSGLAGIGERVATHGGRLTLGNRAGGGFAVEIWLPLAEG
jgi:signal transduction histidine kinase